MPHHGLLGLLIAWALLASLCDAHTCQGDSCALDSVMAARPTGGLLRIAVSQRGAASYSNRLLEEFTTQWRALNPGLPVIDRDVQTIPHLSFDALEAGRADPASHSPTLAAAFQLAADITDELLTCRHLVIASPMYNWGPPSALKVRHWRSGLFHLGSDWCGWTTRSAGLVTGLD